MRVRTRRILFSLLLGLPVLVAFACGHAERKFDDPPVDGGKGGEGSDGDLGNNAGNSSTDGSSGGSGNDGTGGSMAEPPVVVDDPPPNPGCDPPALVEPLVVQSVFPSNKGVAAGSGVVFNFGNLSKDCAVLECRGTRADQPAGDWGACAIVGDDKTKIQPFGTGDDPSQDGSWAIDVRERFDGAAGQVFRHNVYVHSSLSRVEACPALAATDSEIFVTAKALFEAGKAGSTSGKFTNYSIESPFIRVEFDPPTFSQLGVSASAGQVEYKSLRRRFTMNADKSLLMMQRVYPSRRNSPNFLHEAKWTGDAARFRCHATAVRVNTALGNSFQPCDAVVMNSQGFGLCLAVDGSGSISKVYTTTWASYVGPEASGTYVQNKWDSFMWRKLARKNPYSPPYDQPVYFSPKCDDESGPCETNELFLPDRSFILD